MQQLTAHYITRDKRRCACQVDDVLVHSHRHLQELVHHAVIVFSPLPDRTGLGTDIAVENLDMSSIYYDQNFNSRESMMSYAQSSLHRTPLDHAWWALVAVHPREKSYWDCRIHPCQC
jgi:hypothetical protein